MGVSAQPRSYRVASEKFKMGPGGNASGPAWKNDDFCCFFLGAQDTKPVPSVGI